MKIEFKDSVPLFVLCLSLSMASYNPIIRESEVLRVGWVIIHTIIAVGYVVGLVILKAIRDLSMENEEVQEWAFNMACMFEDCTYTSHEQFMKDARIHLENLIELVGTWTPPESGTKRSAHEVKTMMKKLEKIIDAHLEVQISNQKWGTDFISLQSTNSRVLIEWKLKIELIKAIQSLRLGQ